MVCRRRERGRLAVAVVPGLVDFRVRTPHGEGIVELSAHRHFEFIAVGFLSADIFYLLGYGLHSLRHGVTLIDGEQHVVFDAVHGGRITDAPVHLHLARQRIVVRLDFLHLRIGKARLDGARCLVDHLFIIRRLVALYNLVF